MAMTNGIIPIPCVHFLKHFIIKKLFDHDKDNPLYSRISNNGSIPKWSLPK